MDTAILKTSWIPVILFPIILTGHTVHYTFLYLSYPAVQWWFHARNISVYLWSITHPPVALYFRTSSVHMWLSDILKKFKKKSIYNKIRILYFVVQRKWNNPQYYIKTYLYCLDKTQPPSYFLGVHQIHC